MSRAKEIYVSGKTLRRLIWIQQVEKNVRTDDQGFPLTTDAIAERLLNEKMEEAYPSLKSMEKRMNALEDQMVVELEQEMKGQQK